MRCIFKSLLGLTLMAFPLFAEDVLLSTPTVETSSSIPISELRPWRQVAQTAFKAPETLEFVVKWGVVTAGRSSLRIEGVDVIDGRPAYHIVSTARSVGVVDTFARVDDLNESWLDIDSLTTVRYTKRLREGKYKMDESVTMDQPRGRWSRDSFRLDKNKQEVKDGELPSNALDVLGSLYYVRAQPLEVGQVFTMDVLSSDKIYPLTLTVKKRETVKVPAGKFDCFLVEPVLRGTGIFITKGKKLEVWMTADSRRMPVKMRSEVFFGHVVADLVRFESQ